jgi:small subunit ribosomal protein S16
MGKKKQPIYKIVAADQRSPRDGRFIEAFGLYNPKTDPRTVEIDEERAMYWLGVGAQPSDTVKSLFREKGFTLKRELRKQGVPEELVEAEMNKWRGLKEAALAEAAKKKSKQSTGATAAKGAAAESEPPKEEAPQAEAKAEEPAAAEAKPEASEPETEAKAEPTEQAEAKAEAEPTEQAEAEKPEAENAEAKGEGEDK